MKIRVKNILTITLLSFVGTINSQTVNNGVMVIRPETVVSMHSDFDNGELGDLVNDGDFYLFKNFNNDGLVTFTPSEKGYTKFVGVDNQKITGSLPSELNNVLFKNTSKQPAFELVGDISISGNSEFNQGILNNNDSEGNITYEKNASHSKTSNESYVNGYTMKKGNRAFIYPSGDKNLYRFAGISAPTEVIASFRGKYLFENSATNYPHNQKNKEIDIINNQEYWILDKMMGSSNVMLTLSWDEDTTTPVDLLKMPQSAIHIVRWDGTKKLWIDEGGVVDEKNRTVTTRVNVSGYSVFTTARVEETLPLCSNLIIYNALSPNEDGNNEFFKIEGLEDCAEENSVEIYNRWGVKVFETKNYGTSVGSNVFKGYSDGRMTVSKKEKLPSGTYFYILSLKIGSGSDTKSVKKAGYLYISDK